MIRTIFALITVSLTLGVRAELSLGAEAGLLEDFESYPDGFDLSAAWPLLNPDFGPGATITSDGGLYPGIDGQAAEFVNLGQPNMIHVRRDSAVVLAPTPDQNIVLSADIFDDGLFPKRFTIGVRFFSGTTAPLNLVQLGMPLLSGPFYAHREWGLLDAPGTPAWDAFSLPEDMNEPPEVGPGWHRFKATITMHELIYELDLHRDGVVDAVDVVPATVHPFGFNDLRFGLMGGPFAPTFVAIDNISLRVEAVPEPAAAALALAAWLAMVVTSVCRTRG